MLWLTVLLRSHTPPQLIAGGELPAADLDNLTKKRKMLQLKWAALLGGANEGGAI